MFGPREGYLAAHCLGDWHFFFRGSLPFALSEIINLLLNNLKILWLNVFIWFKTPAFKAFRNKVREIHVPSSLDCSHRGCALHVITGTALINKESRAFYVVCCQCLLVLFFALLSKKRNWGNTAKDHTIVSCWRCLLKSKKERKSVCD